MWVPSQAACGRFLFTQLQRVRGQWVSEMILPALDHPSQEGKGLVPSSPVMKTELAAITEGGWSKILLCPSMVNIVSGLPTWTHAQTHPLCVCVCPHTCVFNFPLNSQARSIL